MRAPEDAPGPGAPGDAAPAIAGVEVGGRIGAGGFATAWAARLDGADVIVKVAHRAGASAAARLAHEHRVLERLGGGGVGAGIGTSTSDGAPRPLARGALGDGRPYLVMSRLAGAPLAAALEAAPGPLALGAGEALALGEALAARLAAVHAHGIVHADLKPENIVVAPGGAVGLVDFGTARLPAEPPAAAVAGAGTIEYMAPEQLGDAPLDARADVYAAAAVLFELLAGRPPFTGDRAALAFQLRNARAPRLRSLAAGVPPALDELLARCLDKRPAARPPDGAALLEALRAIPRRRPIAATAAEAPAVEPGHARSGARADPRSAPAVEAWCALVAVEPADLAAVAPLAEAMQRRGGALARRRGARLVFAFEAGRHLVPARAAAEAAAEALDTGARAATVHVAMLTARRRADGTAAYFGDELERTDAWASGAAKAPAVAAGSDAGARAPTADGSGVITPRGRIVALTDAAAAALAPFAPGTPRPLVGRDAELGELLALAAGAREGRGPALALITAAPGVGKTALLEAFAGTVAATPRATTPGTAPTQPAGAARRPNTPAAASGAWGNALTPQSTAPGPPSAPAHPSSAPAPARGESVPPSAPAQASIAPVPASGARPRVPTMRLVSLAVAPPLLGGPPNGVRELLELMPPGGELDELARGAAAWIFDPRDPRAIAPLQAAPGALRAAAARAIASGVARAAAGGPLAIVVDDAHLADGAVLDGLALAARAHAGAPVAIVVAGRPELERPDLERVPLARTLELGPLAADAAAALARALLAPVEVVPEAALARLGARTQGHPLELIELAAALRRGGAIARSARGRWELDLAAVDRVLEHVPASHLYRWLAEQAFADLPPPLLAHAELVALLGGDVTARDLAGVIAELERAGAAARYPLDAERGLELLREAGVLVRAGGAYRFRRALLVDLRESVAPGEARAVHNAAVVAYAAREDLSADERRARLAHHAHAAGDHSVAAPVYAELGRLALARHRYAEADAAFTRALDAPDAPDGAHHGRGIARYRTGRHDAAAEDFATARAAARARGDRAAEATILLDEAMSLDWAIEYRAAAVRVDEAAALVDDAAGPRLRAYLAMSEARSHIRANREPDAIAPLERAIAGAAPLGDEAYEILVVALLQSAPILATWGRLDDARAQFDRVLALTAAAGDRLHHCAALANRLWRPFATPELASLRRDHAGVLAIAAELGHFIIEFTGEVNFAGALHHLGYGELALEHATRAVALETTRLGDAARPEAALLRARILAASGADPSALADALAAIDTHQRTARAAARAEALLTPADQVLFDALASRRPLEPSIAAALRARGTALLPRHELAELERLLARS